MKEIKSTKNYKQFKKLIGNRKVDELRVNKIMKSIKNVGYITSPIIVNENFEVIDGQGRLEALERLHLPVEYIVEEGVGINECIAMNIYQTNWTMIDYIVSYASRGNENYIKLLKMHKEYPEFTIHALGTALFGIGKICGAIIHRGELQISDDLYNSAIERLEYVRQFNDVIVEMKVNRECLRQTLLFTTFLEEVDKENLLSVFLKEGKLLKPYHTIPECMQSIEELYNYGKHKRVYLYVLYDTLARENGKKGIKFVNETGKNIYNRNKEVELESAEQLNKALEEIKEED